MILLIKTIGSSPLPLHSFAAVLDGVALGVLLQDLVLPAGQGVEDSLQVIVRDVQTLLELLEAETLVSLLLVERQDGHGLESGDLQVVRLGTPGRADGRVAQRPDPG